MVYLFRDNVLINTPKMVFRIISIFFVSALLASRPAIAQVTTFEWLQQPVVGVSMSCLASDGIGNCYAGGTDGYLVRYEPSGIAVWAINIAGIANGSERRGLRDRICV